MSTSPSNSNTSATSSADARERFIAAALVANEPGLMAAAVDAGATPDQAREAVLSVFLQLARKNPDTLGSAVKPWLEEGLRKQTKHFTGPATAAAPGEEVRWKRIAGPAAAPPAAAASPATIPTLLPNQRETIVRTARDAAAPKPGKPAAHPKWLFPMVAAAAGIVTLVVLLNKPDQPAFPEKPAATPDNRTTPPPSPGSANAAPLPPPATSGGRTPAPPSPQPPASASPATADLPFSGPPLPGMTEGRFPATSFGAGVRDRDKLIESRPAAYAELMAGVSKIAPLSDSATVPETSPRTPVTTAAARQMPLPVLAGRASLGWIEASVTEKKLPPAKIVRAEELINALDLTPAGAAGISKGTTLSAEALACPWKPSATLVLVRIQGAADGPRTVEATLDLDPAAVSQVRVIGFDPAPGMESAPLLRVLPQKTATTLLLELEPRASAVTLGRILWKVDGKDAPPLEVKRNSDQEPSNDARFAALVAAWAMWLTGQQGDSIDDELVSGLGRECAATDLPPARSRVLLLIAKSLEIGND